jgi:hypothetical protein
MFLAKQEEIPSRQWGTQSRSAEMRLVPVAAVENSRNAAADKMDSRAVHKDHGGAKSPSILACSSDPED